MQSNPASTYEGPHMLGRLLACMAIPTVLLLSACGGGGGGSTPAAVTTTTQVATTAPVITAPTNVTAGQSGYAASIANLPAGTTYVWTVSGGTVDSGDGTSSISFTPAASGSVSFSVVATTSGDDPSVAGTATSTIVAAPTITSFVASTATITAGATDNLTGVFAGGAGVITPGNLPDTSSTPVTVTPSVNTTYTLTVTNIAGTSVTMTASVNVAAAVPSPTITGFAPTSGGVGASVTLTGTNFTGTTGVKFNGVAVVSPTINSATSITATVPASATTGPVSVTTPGGIATSVGNFTVVAAPAITGFAPTSGGIGASVTLTGTNFTGATSVMFNGMAVVSPTVNSATSITATVPASATTGPVSVTTPGGTATSAGSFTVLPAPTITSFTPLNGMVGTVVTLTGTGFTGVSAVSFSGTAAVTFAASSDTSITATVPASASSGTISVTAPGGGVTSSTSFTVVPAPTLTGFTPASGGTGVTVTLTGTNLALASSVTFPGASAVTSFVSPATATTITVLVPAGATPGPISVTTPGGTAASSGRFVAGSLALYAGAASGIGNVNNTLTPLVATNARFYGPSSAVFDAAGNLYVADSLNDVIRVISPTGAVTTLAGTPGVAGSADSGMPGGPLFNNPTALAIDAVGNIYVADTGNFSVRVIAHGSGTVTTLATSLSHPSGIAVDGAGTTVFLADSNVSAIYSIPVVPPPTLSTPITLTSAGLVRPNGLALVGTLLYVADSGHNQIATIDTALTPLPVAPVIFAAGFNNPMGVAVDAVSGNVYVADSSNQVIQLVTTGPTTVTTLAGTITHSGSSDTPAYFNFPTGVTLDSAGNIWVCDFNNNTVRELTPSTKPPTSASTSTVTTVAGMAGSPGFLNNTLPLITLFSAPTNLAVDPTNGNVFVADTNNHLIREISAAGVVTTLAGTTGVSGSSDGPTAKFNAPIGVAVDANPLNSLTFGNVYVADTNNSTIRVIHSDGTVATVAGTPLTPGSTDTATGSPLFNFPFGVAVATNGNIYVADTFNNTIRMIDTAGTVTTVAGTPPPAMPGSTDSPSPLFNLPYAVAVDNSTLATAGTIYVADTNNNTIRKISAGVVSTLAGTAGVTGSADGPGPAASFNHPDALAVDSATGNIYVADTNNQTIRMITPGGTVTTLVGVGGIGNIVPGPLPASLAFPFGIAVDPTLGKLVISVNDAILTSPY